MLFLVEEHGGRIAIFNDPGGKNIMSLNVQKTKTGYFEITDPVDVEKKLVRIGVFEGAQSGYVEVLGADAQFRVNGNAHDYAEAFDLADRGGIRPGSVVAEASNGRGLVLASGEYNPAVVGVIAGAGEFHSGMVIGSRDDGTSDLPVATGGQVFVRVTAESGPIKVGDLLVNSSIAGVAMHGVDQGRLTGTVIGKALQPYSDHQEGLIRMLVLNR